MPGLIEFLRQYGLREYLSMVMVAALCGSGVAALINVSSHGAAGGQVLVKTKAQIEADSSRLLTTRVSAPARPVRRARRQASRAAAARLAAVRTPAPATAPEPRVVTRPRSAPAATPVVRAPRPAATPAPAPKHASSDAGGKSGGSLQFDDSG